MLKYRVTAAYQRFGPIKLITKVKFENSRWFYFHPQDQLLYLHPIQMNKVYHFKRFHVLPQINLSATDFKRHYRFDDASGNVLMANGHPLLTDEQYERDHPHLLEETV